MFSPPQYSIAIVSEEWVTSLIVDPGIHKASVLYINAGIYVPISRSFHGKSDFIVLNC
jgi:hypothetical protein